MAKWWRMIGFLVLLLSLGVARANANEDPPISVNISCSANGSVSPEGGMMWPANTSITITATPTMGYRVDQWYVNGAPNGGDYNSLRMVLGNTDVTVFVQFLHITNQVRAWASSGGSLSPNSDKDLIQVDWGADLSFTAQPDAHYHVDEWRVDDVVTRRGGTSFTLQHVTEGHDVSVSFAPDVYTVQAIAGAHGSVSPTGEVKVVYGEFQAFAATPEEGYEVAFWSLDSQVVQTNGVAFWLMDVESNHVLEVTFSRPELSIRLTSTNTVVLSWPLLYAGWTLQVTTNLSNSLSVWTDLGPPYLTNTVDCRRLAPTATGARFYRLSSP